MANSWKKVSLIVTLAFISSVFEPCLTLSDPAGTFHNPIIDTSAFDPHIQTHTDGYYYMTLTIANGIHVYKSNTLSDWRLAERKLVYTTPVGLSNPEHSEIHFIHNNWYIYVCMNGTDLLRQTFVIQAENPNNPLGHYTQEKQLKTVLPEENTYQNDATVMQYSNDGLYFLSTGHRPNQTSPPVIFISQMSDPSTINGTKVLIKEPPGSSGFSSGPANPQVYRHGNRTVLLYTDTVNGTRCLGMMGIDNGMNPLVPGNWWHHAQDSVFAQNVAEDVLSPGYGSIIHSQDLKENWLLYHANQNGTTTTARIQKLTWSEDGSPIFPLPAGLSTALPLPSGDM